MNIKRIMALVLTICMVLSFTSFAKEEAATRGEVAQYLIEAADFYNPGVQKDDILLGYEDGSLHEEWYVTRAEALVMLKRAFSDLPEPKGHNKRVALVAEDFYDVPKWAQNELAEVFDSGIVAGTGKNTFSPNEHITMKQLELFVKRVYSLYAQNPRDDFYAAANKEILEETELNYGQYINGTLQSVQDGSAEDISIIINQIVYGKNPAGSPKQKIADLYECFMDTKTINKNSVKPIEKYLEKIDSVKNIGELSLVQKTLSEELCVSPFISFSLSVDFENNNGYMLCFEPFRPIMNKEFYEEDNKDTYNAYRSYLKTLLIVGGDEDEEAEKKVESYIEFEKEISQSMLSSEDTNDVETIKNIYKLNKIEAMFPDFDLSAELECKNLMSDDRVLVMDTGLLKKISQMYNQANIDVLRIACEISLLNKWGKLLDERIERAYEDLENALYGVEGYYSREQLAEMMIQEVMPEYLGEIYVEKHFDKKSKQDVTAMIYDIREVFKERVEKLSWMSDKAKERAIKKLDNMKLMVGYPDNFDSYIDEVEIVPRKKGGTLFSNMLAIEKAATKNIGAMQFYERDNTVWPFAPYVVNAGYDATINAMIFPAAILRSPIYDKNASYEKNLGGIGYIIAHEMTHAFDSNGALFDEDGNMSVWWTDDDYAAFDSLCNDVVDFYEEYEAIPGVKTNGTLTLGENLSDMGAAACIVQLASKKNNADFKELFFAMANTFASTSTREYAKLAMQSDTHSYDKVRINCAVMQLEEFYDTFGVKEGDGMYIPPEKRITVW